MADLSALLDMIPVKDIAKQLGINEDVAEAAVKQVLPGLVGGLAANAQDKGGAASLEKALQHHKGTAPHKVAEIDTADGEKIVKNVFGSHTDQVANKLAAATTKAAPSAGEVTGDLIKQILPIVAPIVLSFIAQQFLSGKGGSTASAPVAAAEPEAAPASTGGDIGSLLGGLLSSPQGQQVAGDLLSGLLGAGKK